MVTGVSLMPQGGVVEEESSDRDWGDANTSAESDSSDAVILLLGTGP